MFNVKEQRTFPRIIVDCEITYKKVTETDLKNGMAINISSNGVLFVANEPLEIGDIMEINVVPGTESIPPLSAIIEVIRVNIQEDQGNYQVAGLIKTLK